MSFSPFRLFSIVFIYLAEPIGILESFAGAPPDGLGRCLVGVRGRRSAKGGGSQG